MHEIELLCGFNHINRTNYNNKGLMLSAAEKKILCGCSKKNRLKPFFPATGYINAFGQEERRWDYGYESIFVYDPDRRCNRVEVNPQPQKSCPAHLKERRHKASCIALCLRAAHADHRRRSLRQGLKAGCWVRKLKDKGGNASLCPCGTLKPPSDFQICP